MNSPTLWALMLLIALAVPAIARAAGEALAEVDGVLITSEEVEKALATQLTQLEEQIYNLKRQRVEALINEKLLAKEAKKRGISVPALLDAEVTSKVGLVTEQEIENFYQANKAQIKGEEEKVREQIRSHLQNQKLQTRREAFLQSLRSQAKVVVNLKPPPVFRAQVSADGAPFKGGATAPVVIVKFEDFHCPFCKQVQPTLVQLLSRYNEKVKLVHKDYPIDQLHPAARKGHEAARCANDQGKFWAYHDKLYENAPKASPEQLKAYAKEVGLDLAAFDQCFASGKYQAAVQRDVDEGARLGITGTPTFFVNGRVLTGAQPLERFAQVIEDELARRQ
ncbi:MAG: thioredoxin domain-containing protein [Chloroflexi bacterium]|nr:thioredoxin domain-containing protein [Chloroflexota bacterium]